MRVMIGTKGPDMGCRNDCCVRAVANAFDKPYAEAALIAKQHGRKRKNCGMKHRQVADMLTNLGAVGKIYEDRGYPPLWRVMLGIEPTKAYIVVIKSPGHAFAITRGVIFDATDDYSKWNQRYTRAAVLSVWEIPQATPQQMNLFEGEV